MRRRGEKEKSIPCVKLLQKRAKAPNESQRALYWSISECNMQGNFVDTRVESRHAG